MATKLAIIVVIFFTVPALLYWQFKVADDDRRALHLKLVEEQGSLIAQSLEPIVENFDGKAISALNSTVSQLNIRDLRIKLLFRPQGRVGSDKFFYVAAAPVVPTDYLDEEREGLLATGVLETLRESCDYREALTTRYTNPAGQIEVLTSITPINSSSGCWAVITSRSTAELLGASIGAPYWMRNEIRFAAAIYVLMAILILVVFGQIWQSLRRFAGISRSIRTQDKRRESFARLNRIPELNSVAEEFDRLVGALRDSAKAIRDAAEENAHAMKTPIGTIRQSIEPLKRSTRADDARARRAIEMLEASVTRLDTLVSVARRLAEIRAKAIYAPQELVDLSTLIERMAEDYQESARERQIRISPEVQENIDVWGNADLLETAVENVLENAISFSPAGGVVTVSLRKCDGRAELLVRDQGPGLPSHLMGKVFDRYFSFRPNDAGTADRVEPAEGDESHLGIGMFIVRRNIETLDGSVAVANRESGGLEVRLTLPLAA
jgi:two-component system sensor histidine kinase ChvG